MSATSLAASLLQIPGFKRRLRDLTRASVIDQFPPLAPEGDAAVIDWPYMLLCASVLAKSECQDAEDAALRIATRCLEVSDVTDAHRDAACVILDTLTNRPAIKLAQERGLVAAGFHERLPRRLHCQWVRRQVAYSVVTRTSATLLLNRFQKQFWDLTEESDWLSVSAPTSTGKSFLLYQWLSDTIQDTPRFLGIYVVPTRALIQQVENDLGAQLQELGLTDVRTTSMPVPPSDDGPSKTLYVLTQERLHLLLNTLPSARTVSVLIIDEAQKTGEGARGVLLQQVLGLVIAHSPTAKIVFASPLSSNPEFLLDWAPKGWNSSALPSQHVAVNQNLLWASQVPRKPQDWSLELCLEDGLERLGTFSLPYRPNPTSKRLPFVAYTLTEKGGGSLIYVNGAAEAEKVALVLADLAREDGTEPYEDADLASLVDLVKKTIHPDYALATVLPQRVAFHYGNMPLIVRAEIERLFRTGAIRFLICTSTLLEGVNLPCKTIFVRGPKKGANDPMCASDFWNLAGRAGRLGKEFQGNIICVDARRKDVWRVPAPQRRSAYAMTSAVETVFANKSDFLDFVTSGTPRNIASKRQDFEYTYSYLAAELAKSGTLEASPSCVHLDDGTRKEIEDAVRQSLVGLEIPTSIIERNPGVSPLAMRSLDTYFRSREGAVQELLPSLPESEDAVDAYVSILGRINAHLAPAFGGPGRTYGLALLVVHWMQGYPLSRMITERIAYYRRVGRSDTLASIIRGTMKDIEEFARFLVPKYTACYIDLLRWFLTQSGQVELATEVHDPNVWLEFGASQQTQLSLMALGLSRTSAIALSEIIASDSFDEAQCLRWLASQNIAALGLPAAITREVEQSLKRPALTANSTPESSKDT